MGDELQESEYHRHLRLQLAASAPQAIGEFTVFFRGLHCLVHVSWVNVWNELISKGWQLAHHVWTSLFTHSGCVAVLCPVVRVGRGSLSDFCALHSASDVCR